MGRDERLKLLYAGHEIYKEKYFGVYRLNGRAVLSLEVPLQSQSLGG